MKPKIAIIGAGWAGLAAAAQLSTQALVTVFEASKQAGGRARGLKNSNSDFVQTDNGQHLLLGAYEQVAHLRQMCGVAEMSDTERLPSQWHMLDGLDFKTRRLPAPLHALLGMLMAKGWSFADKRRWLQDAYALKRAQKWLPTHDVSVMTWLTGRYVPAKHIAEFWKPLVLATMNTPLEVASLNTLAVVLDEGLLNKRSASDFCLATCDLHTWLVEPVCLYLQQQGVSIRYQNRIAGLEKAADGRHWMVGGESFDRVVIATAPYHVVDVLGEQYATSVKTYFASLSYSAITTVYLRYGVPLPLPHVIQGTAYGSSQWLINREKLHIAKQELAAVISVSETHAHKSSEAWVNAVHQDLLALQADLPEPTHSLVITEKRATVQASVNRGLPPMAALNKQGLYLAGDYCHPRYPATLEGAVQSGFATASMCVADWKNA